MVWESLRISRSGCQTRGGRRFFTAGCSAGSLMKVAVTARRSRRQGSRAECTKLLCLGLWSSSASLILTLRSGGSVSWAARLTRAGRKGQLGNTRVLAGTTRACRSGCTSRRLADCGGAARAFGRCCQARFRTVTGLAGFRTAQRRPGAVLVKPARRGAATAALRTAAMTCADNPARSRWAASFMVVSRTWCRASMSRWPRAAAAMAPGVPPRWRVRLVMPGAAAAGRSRPSCGSRTAGSIQNAWAGGEQAVRRRKNPAGVRVSSRPCPRSRAVRVTGTCARSSASGAANRDGLIVLDRGEQVTGAPYLRPGSGRFPPGCAARPG